jgi:AcrR family transcriptional regulator
MGVTERRERQRAELREQILTAAKAIILEDGFEGLTMRKIAEAIEYSAATIYLHFASREAIALQLVTEGFAELMLFMAPAVVIADPLARLRALGDAYVRFGLERPQTYRLIFMTDPRLSKVVSDHVIEKGDDDPGARCFDALVQTVGELIDNRTFKRVDPEVAANCFWSALHGIVSLHITCEAMLTDVIGTSHVMRDALVNGLRA